MDDKIYTSEIDTIRFETVIDSFVLETCEWHKKLRAVLLAKHMDFHEQYILSTSDKDLSSRIRDYIIKV